SVRPQRPVPELESPPLRAQRKSETDDPGNEVGTPLARSVGVLPTQVGGRARLFLPGQPELTCLEQKRAARVAPALRRACQG
ncbi:MAG: hypothetical protein QF619_12345, partial [Candidatus Binatia bacterium]|nr:hypothetical protein [Candidatus Binatia bacterium]